MTISSMTAFAHRRSEHPWGTAIWELRSVNHRYLELSFKLPEGWRQLEPELRATGFATPCNEARSNAHCG